jgi:Cu(I)/Ag(I) efflux system protein CusF
MKTSLIKATAVFGFILIAMAAHADDASANKGKEMGSMNMESSGNHQPMTMPTNVGEVKAVDKAGKSITITHGPIKSKTVEMTPMTMTFPVQSAPLLSNVKVGDRVTFNVENVLDVATVTALTIQK